MRSYSRGLIDTRDKNEGVLIHKELQQFSPNLSQSKYFAKDSNYSNGNPEIQKKLSQNGLTSGVTQTHFQKYNSNLISTSLNKSNNNNGVSSNNVSGVFTASLLNFSNQVINNPQQVRQQDSTKIMPQSIKKVKESAINLMTPPLIKLEVSPLKKLDSLIKKKPINSNINSSKASISLATSCAVNSNNTSTRISQAVNADDLENQSSQLQLASNNLVNIKLSQEVFKLRRNDEKLFSNLNSKLSSLPSSEFNSPDKYRVMQATQDTRDSTSNTLSVKMHKHSKSNSLNSDYTLKSSIKTPEDLHFFYVSTIQINKEFINKFDIEENK